MRGIRQFKLMVAFLLASAAGVFSSPVIAGDLASFSELVDSELSAQLSPTLSTYNQMVLLRQQGNQNFAEVTQQGEDNLVAAFQYGSRNSLIVQQLGSSNQVSVLQMNDNNELTLTQVGSRNQADVVQAGSQAIDILQVGSDLSFSIYQK